MLKPFKVNQGVLIKMAAFSKFMNCQSRIFAGDILVLTPPMHCKKRLEFTVKDLATGCSALYRKKHWMIPKLLEMTMTPCKNTQQAYNVEMTLY